VSAPQTITLDSIVPGMELGETVFGPIERADIVRYAGASGDFNPIHTDESYAQRTGAPTVFAMGMLPAGYLAHAVADWVGGPHRIRRFKVRFTTRVWPGDELVCVGTVSEIQGDVVQVKLEARRRGSGPTASVAVDEEVALVGEAEIGFGDQNWG
jgi:peroxisomal enoyl-CoA hydratase 2